MVIVLDCFWWVAYYEEEECSNKNVFLLVNYQTSKLAIIVNALVHVSINLNLCSKENDIRDQDTTPRGRILHAWNRLMAF